MLFLGKKGYNNQLQKFLDREEQKMFSYFEDLKGLSV